MKHKARVIAFYLPQYHPIPENDKWWGKGFTEWLNVGKAKPLFKGHNQPRVPTDLGYYDLRLPDVREQQAELAREAGIEGFCYWHYWFGNGKRLLERPFSEVLESGKPDFPFCLGWANHNWTNKSWEVGTRKVAEQTLMEMVYNIDEYTKHFYDVLPAFKDQRYITVEGKPLFIVWRPLDIPDTEKFISHWNSLARNNGFDGVYFVGLQYNMLPNDRTIQNVLFKNAPDQAAELYKRVLDAGFNAVNSRGHYRADYYVRPALEVFLRTVVRRIFNYTLVSKLQQRDANKYMYVKEDEWENVYPTLVPNWDRSPRSGRNAMIYTNSTPEVFKEQIHMVLQKLQKKDDEHKIVFLMSWNEWGEGNYVEPDLQYGHGYLDALRETIVENG